MLHRLRFGLAFVAIIGIALLSAQAQQFGTGTVFVTGKGDITFPLTPPTAAGATPGTINNMSIGQTTKAPGTFSTLAADSFSGTATNDSICTTYMFTGTPAATDQAFFIAPKALVVTSIRQVHAVAAGGTSTLQVTKDTGTAAPGAGTDLLTAAFNLNATANTVQVGTLVTTAGVTTLAAGDRLSVDFADAIQSSAGVVVTACMRPA